METKMIPAGSPTGTVRERRTPSPSSPRVSAEPVRTIRTPSPEDHGAEMLSLPSELIERALAQGKFLSSVRPSTRARWQRAAGSVPAPITPGKEPSKENSKPVRALTPRPGILEPKAKPALEEPRRARKPGKHKDHLATPILGPRPTIPYGFAFEAPPEAKPLQLKLGIAQYRERLRELTIPEPDTDPARMASPGTQYPPGFLPFIPGLPTAPKLALPPQGDEILAPARFVAKPTAKPGTLLRPQAHYATPSNSIERIREELRRMQAGAQSHGAFYSHTTSLGFATPSTPFIGATRKLPQPPEQLHDD